jgi:hypothetical protein
MRILHSPPFIAPVNKYFTQSGGPDASNTEISRRLITSSTIIYAYAEIGSSCYKGLSDEKPMEITITPQPRPIINTAPSAIILLKPIPIT